MIKKCANLGAKFCPVTAHFWDRRLKAFFTTHWYFWHFFLGCFWFFWAPLWSLFGNIDAVLGGVSTQKPVKTRWFLMFLKRFFAAPDDAFGFTLAHFGAKLPSKLGPKWVPKLALTWFKFCYVEMWTKLFTEIVIPLLVSFLSNFGINIGGYFGG